MSQGISNMSQDTLSTAERRTIADSNNFILVITQAVRNIIQQAENITQAAANISTPIEGQRKRSEILFTSLSTILSTILSKKKISEIASKVCTGFKNYHWAPKLIFCDIFSCIWPILKSIWRFCCSLICNMIDEPVDCSFRVTISSMYGLWFFLMVSYCIIVMKDIKMDECELSGHLQRIQLAFLLLTSFLALLLAIRLLTGPSVFERVDDKEKPSKATESTAPFTLFVAIFAVIISLGGILLSSTSGPENFQLAVQRIASKENKNKACSTWLDPQGQLFMIQTSFEEPNLDPAPLQQIITKGHENICLCNYSNFEQKQDALKDLQGNLSEVLEYVDTNLHSSSAVYQFAAINQGEKISQITTSTDKMRINVKDTNLELLGGQFYFPFNKPKEHWKLMTSVHTIWGDPSDKNQLRAVMPWGDLRCFIHVNGKLFCSYQRATEPARAEGPCRFFWLWERSQDFQDSQDSKESKNSTSKFEIENMNNKGFMDAFFALHVQEETMFRIYRYSINLLVGSRIINESVDLDHIQKTRTRETYKRLTIRNIIKYLTHHGYYAVQPQPIDDSDLNRAGQYVLSSVRERKGEESIGIIDAGELLDKFGGCKDKEEAKLNKTSRYYVKRQETLDVFSAAPYESLNHDERVYQIFIAVKIGRLAVRAAVFDDRFITSGFTDRVFWVG